MEERQYGCVAAQRYDFKEAFYVQASDLGTNRVVVSLREERLLESLLPILGLLGEKVDVLLREGLSSRDEELWQNSFYASGKETDEICRIVTKHITFFLSDGNHQVGFRSLSSNDSVFVDDHNLILIYAQHTQPYEALLKSLGIKKRLVKTRLNVDHYHVSPETAHKYLENIVLDFGLR